MFTFKGYNLSHWSFFLDHRKQLVLWNQWMDRDKCYYEMTQENDKFEVGQKFQIYNKTFADLSERNNSKHRRDTFMELDTKEVRQLCLKDTARLAEMIGDIFKGKHISDNTGTCSCTTLVKNKVNNVYSFFFGDRKNAILYCIESNVFDDLLQKASYTSNLRLVHSHFNNLWFDGIKTIQFEVDGTTYKKEITDKNVMAKELGVNDVMNFPTDHRSPVLRVDEIESKIGNLDSTWMMVVTFADKTEKSVLVDITPGACTYSFTKCSALYQQDGRYIQNYMVKLSNKNVVRNYEYKITWDLKKPSAISSKISLIAQKCLLTNKGTGTLRFLLDDNNKIDGCQMLIA